MHIRLLANAKFLRFALLPAWVYPLAPVLVVGLILKTDSPIAAVAFSVLPSVVFSVMIQLPFLTASPADLRPSHRGFSRPLPLFAVFHWLSHLHEYYGNLLARQFELQ